MKRQDAKYALDRAINDGLIEAWKLQDDSLLIEVTYRIASHVSRVRVFEGATSAIAWLEDRRIEQAVNR